MLAIRLDNIGDVLMTTPALAALAADPSRQVTLLASRAGAALAGHLPCVSDVMVYDCPWTGGLHGDPQADQRLLRQLVERRFDAAVIFTVCTQSALPAALMCRMADIGLRLAHSRENPYALLTDWVRDTDVVCTPMRHEVQRQLDLVARVGFHASDDRLVFECRPAERDTARRKLALAGADPGRPWVVIHPGSSAASRRYPPERFGLAAAGIAARSDAQIVFTGGPDDVAACAQAQQSMGCASVSLAGALSLGELAALIGDAAVVVCNNSAPAHLAAAMGTPTVVLYALTNPQHTPWRVRTRVLNHDVACRNCLKSVCPEGHHGCLLGVEPHEVADAAVALLGGRLARPLAVRLGRAA
ncbi:MAG TPA: glycosyltransferase family 9 protein [Burkholderiaceae bacterium]|nr:glycosyltransferase family 9 protein [Burkholderiaceae bacterium]